MAVFVHSFSSYARVQRLQQRHTYDRVAALLAVGYAMSVVDGALSEEAVVVARLSYAFRRCSALHVDASRRVLRFLLSFLQIIFDALPDALENALR